MNLKSFFKTLIFTVLIVCCYSVTAQNSGLVQDSENQPIENVSVFIADQSILLKTNKLGEFFLIVNCLITPILTSIKMNMFLNL